MKKIVFVFLFIFFSVFSQKNDKEVKVLLDSLSNKQMTFIVNGNVEGFLGGYSKNYTDLGGGSKGTGKVDFKKWKEKITEFVSSDSFKKIKGKPISNFFKLDEKEILNYKCESKRFDYEPNENDYKVLIPGKKNSLFGEGWYGIYRFQNGEWKIIAGD